MVPSWIEEAHQDLVKDDVVEHLGARLLGQGTGKAPRVGAAAVEEIGDARAAERSQRRVHWETPRPARELGIPVQLRQTKRRGSFPLEAARRSPKTRKSLNSAPTLGVPPEPAVFDAQARPLHR